MQALSGIEANLAIFLAASMLVVPVLTRFGLGTAPGFLLAGMLIGPWGLALIRDAGVINQFTGFIVIVFLFYLGLELNSKQLRRDVKSILTLGAMQFALAATVFFIITLLFGRTWFEALAVALALSVSTSTLVSALTRKDSLSRSRSGYVGQAILRFHALSLIPLLIVIPLLGLGSPLAEPEGIWGVLKALLLLAVVMVVGRYCLRYLYRYIVAFRLPELFTGITLFVFLCTVLLTEALGLSIGLGALACGMLLAETEYSQQIKSDLEPFRGLVIGLFLIAIGLAVDFGLFLQRPSETLGLLLVLLLVKAAAFYCVASYAQLPFLQRPWFSLLLSQGGELTFVLLVLGAAAHAIEAKLAASLTIVVAFSMLLTPWLLKLTLRWQHKAQAADQISSSSEQDSEKPQVIVAGFGRFGQIVSRLLVSTDVQITVVDYDPTYLEQAKKLGYNTRYGDALRPGLLQSIGAAQAVVLVVATDDREKSLALVRLAKRRYPQLKVAARAWDLPHQWQLMMAGADSVQRETLGSAVALGEDVMSLLGQDFDEIERRSEAFLDHNARLTQNLYEQWRTSSERNDANWVSSGGREELAKVIEGDISQAELERKIEGD